MELYNALRTQIEFHQGYRLNDVPPQTLDELLMAVGCGGLDEQCSQLLAELVGTEFLAFGELLLNDEAATLGMTLFDLTTGQEVRTRSHSVDAENRGTLLEFHQVVGRSLLNEDEGSLSVEVFPEGASVFVNDEPQGAAPLTIEGLSYGLYSVRVEAEGFEGQEKLGIVDIGSGEVNFVLSVPIEARDTARVEVASPYAPWLLVGVGAAATGVGLYLGVQEGETQREFDALVAERSLDRPRAEELARDGQRQAALSNAFVSSGLVAVAGGVIWKVVGDMRRNRRGIDDMEESDPWAYVRPAR